MGYKILFYTTLLLVQLGLSPASHAIGQGSFESCQEIKDKIDHYSRLKRKGGTTSQLDHWHRMRNKYKEKYAQYNCKVYLGRFK